MNLIIHFHTTVWQRGQLSISYMFCSLSDIDLKLDSDTDFDTTKAITVNAWYFMPSFIHWGNTLCACQPQDTNSKLCQSHPLFALLLRNVATLNLQKKGTSCTICGKNNHVLMFQHLKVLLRSSQWPFYMGRTWAHWLPVFSAVLCCQIKAGSIINK